MFLMYEELKKLNRMSWHAQIEQTTLYYLLGFTDFNHLCLIKCFTVTTLVFNTHFIRWHSFLVDIYKHSYAFVQKILCTDIK